MFNYGLIIYNFVERLGSLTIDIAITLRSAIYFLFLGSSMQLRTEGLS